MSASGNRYRDLYDRVVSNSVPEYESAEACWNTTVKTRCRYGYGRMSLYVPGLGKQFKITIHVAMFVMMESGARSPDEVYLEYLSYRCSGLEGDHLCVNSKCCNPGHLEAVTASENCRRRETQRNRWKEYR